MRRFTALLSLSLLLVACQSAPQTSAPAGLSLSEGLGLSSVAESPLNFVSKSHAQAGSYQSPRLAPLKFEPSAKLRVKGNTVTLELRLPPLPEQGFRTQMLDLSVAAKIRATVSDSYGKTYQPVGAVAGLVDYPASGVINLTFNNVVPDQLLFVELQTRDLGADIPQADLAAVVTHTSASNLTTTLNFQTTPTAKAMRALLTANATRARAIDLGALNTLMTAITGYNAGPPASYTTHPSLVDSGQLAADLVAIDPGGLTAANYRRVGATVSVDISGLVGADTLDVQVTDAASAVATGRGNGNDQLITTATPGTGLRVLVGGAAGNSTQYTLSVTPNTNLTLSNAATTDVTVVATPATVTVGSLSPAFATINSTITVNGTGFSTTAANNKVYFGSTEATVNSATATSLNVTVPAGLSGTQALRVEVGATTSNTFNFDVVPAISSFLPTTGTAGDTITINGTGFSSTAGNNTVRFGGTVVPVDSATPTSLTVTLPNTFSFTQAVTVQVGSRSSASQNFTVPSPVIASLSATSGSTDDVITITGTGFSSVLAYNIVRFGTVAATVSAASATSLTVSVPERPANFAAASVQVSVATSNNSGFTVLPKLTSLTTAEVAGGKAVLIRGQTLTIAGTNFDPVLANNLVRFFMSNGFVYAAVPNAVSATSLTVTVPSDVSVVGDVDVHVSTNGHNSNTLSAMVPGVALNVSNGGFY